MPLILVHVREGRRGGGEGGVWRNLREGGGECRLRGNGATQSAPLGIGHKRLENSGSVFNGSIRNGGRRGRTNK